MGKFYRVAHDGFEGEDIGSYVTREGKEGVVLQQIGTRVVHVYARRWLTPLAADCPCGKGEDPCPGPDGRPLCAN